ncbi:hypothetical protein HY971_03980 [Candidatus Kaiserbacteria bacterium]|nr:hypothetical protein [Candidatus Kaiserbacteria bacterium]
MKNTIITIVAIAILAIGFVLLYQNRSTVRETPTASETVRQLSSSQQWETKTEEEAGVTVVITPLDLSPQFAEWKFDVGLNTHSVELDQDMTRIAVLTDDRRNEYKPVAWDGVAPGGHHREGVLIFRAVSPMPRSVELTIKDIGGIPERSFKWDLK